jgi:hypothetical protein
MYAVIYNNIFCAVQHFLPLGRGAVANRYVEVGSHEPPRLTV